MNPGGNKQAQQQSAVKRTVRDALLMARMPTSGARMVPGFLIVGAQRCGTTAMSRALGQHPAVFGPVLHDEEVHYFDVSYGRGLAWYRAHFPLLAGARRAGREAGVEPVAFESSPYYMFHPLAGQRIATDLPDVKVIVLLRDPVERAYSAHSHEVSRGHETEPFERALELEPARLAGEADRIVADPAYYSHSHQHHAYLARGHYAEQLERLERLFGRDRMHVVDSSEFFTSPEPVYDGVLNFIGLPNLGYPAFGRHNARPRSPMPPSARRTLERHFGPHDERLVAWLGWEPSWCRGRSSFTAWPKRAAPPAVPAAKPRGDP